MCINLHEETFDGAKNSDMNSYMIRLVTAFSTQSCFGVGSLLWQKERN